MPAPTPDALFQQATHAFMAGQRTEAQSLLKQALRLNPTHADSWALIALLTDNPTHRRDALQRALKSDPAHPDARQMLRELDGEAALPALPETPVAPPPPRPEPASLSLDDLLDEAPPTAVAPKAPPAPPAPVAEVVPPPLASAPPVESALPAPTPPPGAFLSLASLVGEEALHPAGEPPAPEPPPPSPPAPQPVLKLKPKTAPVKQPPPAWVMEVQGMLPALLGVVFLLLVLWSGFTWWNGLNRQRVSNLPSGLTVQVPVPLVKPEWLTEAEALRWSNQLAQAESALRDAATRPEDEALAQAALSLLLTDQVGRANDAVQAAQRATEIAPNPVQQGYAAYALIMALEAQRAPADGARLRALADEATRAAPRNPYTEIARARAATANADWSQAMTAARSAVHSASEAEQPEAWVALARAAWEQGDLVVAEEAYGKALAVRDYGPWQIERAILLARQRRFDEASTILGHGRSLVPDLPNVAIAEAELALARQDAAAAQTASERLATLLPERGYADFWRGALAEQQSQWTEAIDAYRLAARDPDLELLARAQVAQVYSASGECQRGQEEAEALREIASVAPEVLLALGEAYLCRGRYDDALALMRRGIQRDPANPALYHLAARAADLDGQIEVAIDYFVLALQYAPSLTGIHPSISDLYLFSGEELGGLRARFHAEIALEFDPTNPAAHTAMGRLLYSARRPAQAVAEFEQVLATGQATILSKVELAQALLAAGDTTRAVSILEPMALGDEKAPAVLYNLARGYRNQGRYAEALDALREYVAFVGEENLSYGTFFFASALADPAGYPISRSAVSGSLQLFLDEYLAEQDARATIMTREGGEWLAVLVPISGVVSDEEQLGTAGLVMAVSALSFSRVTPALNGGVRVQIENPDGTLRFAASVPADIAREYSDGILGESQLIATMRYERDSASDQTMDAARAERIGLDLSEHRHLPLLTDVPFNTIGRDDLATRFASDSSDARTQAAMRSAEALYRLLGLIGPDESLAQIQGEASVARVAGFYEPEEGAFYLVTDEGGGDQVQDEITVAHEYQHALQDQHWGLERFREAADSDQQRAFQALAEGEATYTSYSYAYGKIPLFDLLGAFSASAQVDEEKLERSPRHVRSTILFPYETGYAFVSAMVEDESGKPDWEKVDALFENPPRSTEQVLHPEKYKSGEQPKPVALPDLAPLGEGWSIEEEDVLGELSLNLLIEPFTGHAIASRAADGWGGDRYALLAGPDGQRAMVMRLVWDRPEEADEFWGLWPLYLRHRASFRRLIDDPLAAVYTRTRWWQGPDQVLFVQREDATTVTIAIGSSREFLQPLADSLPGAAWERSQP